MREQLIEDNMDLVYSIIRKNYPTFVGDEDLIQSGMLGLCQAANSFNPEKSKFSTYAYRCIVNALRREFITRFKHKDQWSLDYPVADNGEIITLCDTLQGDSDVSYVELDDKSFTDTDRQVLQLYMQGFRQCDIARKLGITKQRVFSIIRRIKIKLQR